MSPHGGNITTARLHNAASNKKKRNHARTPDPAVEVVALSPQALLESDKYKCEICSLGFQREQNLQIHHRCHKVPWELLKQAAAADKPQRSGKRVFVCPEPSGLHHDPPHALGDLVGIKKHFRRKHSSHRQWACSKCGKAYAVHSDYNAHLKTCGTRGHTCDCGRVLSRVESFIEHQDTCTGGPVPPYHQLPACPSVDTDYYPAMWLHRPQLPSTPLGQRYSEIHNIDLQLSLSSPVLISPEAAATEEAKVAELQLSIEPAAVRTPSEDPRAATARLKDEAMEQLKLASEARQQARWQLELAKHEFESAKRIRQLSQAELDGVRAVRQRAVKQINSALLQITCCACKRQFLSSLAAEENSIAANYMSPAMIEGDEPTGDHIQAL